MFFVKYIIKKIILYIMFSIICFKEVDHLVSDIIKQIITNIHSIEYNCFTAILHLHFVVHSKLKSYAIHPQNDS